MPTNVTLNGISYAIPATGEGGWGASVTSYLIALSSAVLQKTGGSFTLSAETDFGATYGLKSVYFKSRNTPATAGIFRLGNAEAVSWRNAANSANLDLKVNSSNILEFGGNPITSLPLGTAHQVLTMNAGATAAEYAKIDNDNVASAAAIDAAKIADASVSNAEFQYLGGVTSDLQTQLNAKLDDVATANDNEVPRFNTNGQALQNSGVTIDDSNNMAGIANVIISGVIDAATATNLDIGGTTATTVNIGRSGQTTVIKGNLQVDGTPTTVNSTVLDVADKNITLNNGGNQASADGGGFTVEMSDATDVAMVYASALASRFKIGDVGSETEVMSVGAVQVITAVKSFDIQLVMKEISTPSTPASGYRALYPKADGKFYHLDDAGIEQELGSGAGAGEPNYITNPSGATDASDWTESTSGQVDITRTNTAAELPRETLTGTGLKIIGTGSTGTYEYVAIPFVLDDAEISVKNKIEFPMKIISGYLEGELEVVIYDVTNAAVITPSTQAIPAATGTFRSSFDATTSQSYELRIRKPLAAVTAGIVISDVVVGPGKVLAGFGGWKQYTESDITFSSTPAGWSLVAMVLMPYKTSNGDWRLKLNLQATMTGTTSTVTATLDGVTFKTGILQAMANLGEVSSSTRSWVNGGSGVISLQGEISTNQFYISADVALDSMPTWAENDSLAFMGANDPEYYSYYDASDIAAGGSFSDQANVTNSSAGSQFASIATAGAANTETAYNLTVPEMQETDSYDLQVSWQGSPWTSFKGDATVANHTRNDNAIYGFSAFGTSTTNIRVTFGNSGRRNTGAIDAVGSTWAGIGASDSYRWRIAVFRSGRATGFGAATATQSGLVNPSSSDTSLQINSGTYTPTKSAETNLASSSVNSITYFRVGKIVVVTGHLTASNNGGAGVNASLEITLPIASNLATSVDLDGHGNNNVDHAPIIVSPSTSNDTAVITIDNPDANANRTWYFSFQYEVK